MLPLEQGQKDLLLGLKVVVNGGAGEGGFGPDVPDGDVPESHGLIEGGTGVDDLFLSGVGQFFRSLGHGRLTAPERTWPRPPRRCLPACPASSSPWGSAPPDSSRPC